MVKRRSENFFIDFDKKKKEEIQYDYEANRIFVTFFYYYYKFNYVNHVISVVLIELIKNVQFCKKRGPARKQK